MLGVEEGDWVWNPVPFCMAQVFSAGVYKAGLFCVDKLHVKGGASQESGGNDNFAICVKIICFS
ncbi:hypothetical protein JCM7447_02700 [Corynebacterium amycolatum]